MLGLNRRERRLFRLSVFAHGLGALGVVFFGFLPSCRKEPEKVHVFELATAAPLPEQHKTHIRSYAMALNRLQGRCWQASRK